MNVEQNFRPVNIFIKAFMKIAYLSHKAARKIILHTLRCFLISEKTFVKSETSYQLRLISARAAKDAKRHGYHILTLAFHLPLSLSVSLIPLLTFENNVENKAAELLSSSDMVSTP